MGDAHDGAEEPDEEMVYFYSPLTNPPFLNKYTKLISDLLQNMSVVDALPGGASEVFALCHDAKKALEKENVVLDIDVTESDNLIIVGDIHGQFADLLQSVLSIRLEQQGEGAEASGGLSGTEYKFLFLGDYVDRGPRGVEVITLLLALKMEYPAHVFLLRGNHEEAQTCRMYGFFQECCVKFGSIGKDAGERALNMTDSAWMRYNMVFCCLPLAAVVRCPSGMFFCVHGGLSPQTRSISGLKLLRRCEYGQLMAATFPLYSSSPKNNGGAALSIDDERSIVDGLLWSDPDEDIFDFQINSRGCGFIFGPNVTKSFLDCNYGYDFQSTLPGRKGGDMQFIVRAHQCVQSGYHWAHGGLVLTLFSAPNYCGMKNKGAFAVLRGEAQVGKDRVSFEYKVYDTAAAPPGPNNRGSRRGSSGSSGGETDTVSQTNATRLSDHFTCIR